MRLLSVALSILRLVKPCHRIVQAPSSYTLEVGMGAESISVDKIATLVLKCCAVYTASSMPFYDWLSLNPSH